MFRDSKTDSNAGEQNPPNPTQPPRNSHENATASPDKQETAPRAFEKIENEAGATDPSNVTPAQNLRADAPGNAGLPGCALDSSGPNLRQNDIDRLAREVAKARGGEGRR
jgi:hypothetical protein